MTAEEIKQRILIERMGKSPQVPNKIPPMTGPRSPASVLTMLMTALACIICPGRTRRGILAWTAGW